MVNLPIHHGHIRSRRASLASNSNRSSVDEGSLAGGEDETTIVEPEQGNVLSHIISQLRPGADLSRVTLPTFILEPRSMLERITNFMAHPETLLPVPTYDDPTERFISVVKFYLSGWHIKPPGVKKPLNPILGETYQCYWEYPDNTKGYYIAEQTSHHPPKSSYFFMAPEHNIRIDGTLKPRSKFLGNSAASMMEGIAVLRLLNRGKPGKPEKYFLTQPNMYARGILFGKMKYELGDHSIVHCPELGLIADVEFKTKGYFTGSYNAIGGTIKNETTGEILYELSGMWNGEMFIKNVLSGQRELLHDANKVKPTPPLVRPLEEQGERESQRLWNKTVQAVIARNHELATDEKTSIEEMQREEAAKRVQDGVDWHPRYFRAVRSKPGESEEGEERLDWILNKEIDGATPEEQAKQILSICPILINQNYHERMPIPPSRASRQSMESLRSNRSFQKQHHENDPISMSASQHLAGIPQEQDDLIDVSQDGGQQVIPEASFSGPAKSMTEPVPVTVAQFTDYSTSTPTPPNDASQAPLRPQPVLRPTDLHEAQTVDDGQAQKEMESQLAKTGVPAHQEQPSALKDFHNELKEVVPSIEAGVSVPEGKKQEVGLKPPTLDRGESESSSDFVDAKGDS